MKLFKLILVLSLSLSFGSTLASDFECKKITGNVQLFPAGGGKCPILKKKARRFPDLTFLHELGIPQTCFVGWMNGILGDTPITGKVISGLTANNLGGVFLTATSAIKIYEEENGNNLGRVFTQDTIFDPEGDTREYLAMVAGSKSFKGGKGHLEIMGNVFGGASFTGTLCVED